MVKMSFNITYPYISISVYLLISKSLYLYIAISLYHYKTRKADYVKIRHEHKLKLDLAADGFRRRASGQFNLLSLSIRNKATFKKFQIAAKNWIRQNVDPG
jgi:hypothetical protein